MIDSLRRAWMTDDPIRAVQIMMAWLVVPLRVWTVAGNDADNPIYRLYPWWLQVVTLITFGAVWLFAYRRGDTWLRVATAAAFVVAVCVALVTGAAAPAAGGWLWWLCVALVQGWAYFRIVSRHTCVRTDGKQWI